MSEIRQNIIQLADNLSEDASHGISLESIPLGVRQLRSSLSRNQSLFNPLTIEECLRWTQTVLDGCDERKMVELLEKTHMSLRNDTQSS